MDPLPPRRIDAHQHFWRPARGDYRWLRPDVAALAPICRNFEPADLQPLLCAHGVVQTVLVQAADSEAETDFLLSLAEAHPFIGGVVGWVDLGRIESNRWRRWNAGQRIPRSCVRSFASGCASMRWCSRGICSRW
jgi:predicted TIM-barrel fold metal-dependent hydrolase